MWNRETLFAHLLIAIEDNVEVDGPWAITHGCKIPSHFRFDLFELPQQCPWRIGCGGQHSSVQKIRLIRDAFRRCLVQG